MPSEAQVKILFVSWKSYVPLSRYSSFCIFNHHMIYQICDVMISINTWDRVHFWIYLLNYKWLTRQTWLIDRYRQGQYFSEITWMIWRAGIKFQVLFNLTTCSNYSRTNYVKSLVFLFFLKGWIKRIKDGKYQLLNIDRFCYIRHFIKILQGTGTSAQSSALSQIYVNNISHKIH